MVKSKFEKKHIIIIGILALVSIVMLYPVVWSIITSFKSTGDILRNRTSFLPEVWTIEGYKSAFAKAPVGRWFFNSVFVTATVILITILTSTLVGYVFAKFDFKHKNRLFWLLLLALMVPSVVTMIPRYLMIQKMGIFNSLWALIIPRIVSPFSIYLSRQFISDIPNSLLEAAKIDGAGPLKTYWRVVIPNLKPLIGSIGIITSVQVWNDYLNPLLMLNDYDKMTLPLGLVMFEGQRGSDLAATMAMANMVMIPMVLVFLIFQKQFIKGITISGMK